MRRVMRQRGKEERGKNNAPSSSLALPCGPEGKIEPVPFAFEVA